MITKADIKFSFRSVSGSCKLRAAIYLSLGLSLFVSENAIAQLVSKTLNVQGVLKSAAGTLLSGSYGMQFTFKKNGSAFTTPCQIAKNSVAVSNGVFNAAVDVSSCNLQTEIPAATAPTITVDIDVDLIHAAYTSSLASFTGLVLSPVAMALVAEKAGTITLPGTNGQVLTYNGTSWVAGGIGGASLTAGSLNLGTSSAITGILPIANGGTGASSLSGLRATINAASSGTNSDITSMTGLTTALTVAQGGTGSTTASGARTALSAAAAGANSDITSLSGILTAISVAQGGTGAINAVSARSNLGAASAGANSDITSLTGLTTALSLAQGGTGASTPAGARAAIAAAGSGANIDITSLTGLTTALPLAEGGTGATTAASARTALGLGTVAVLNTSGSATDFLHGDGTWAPLGALVTSVAGRSGVVTLTTADIGGLGTAGTLATSAVLLKGNNLSELTATASTARSNISAATSGANSDITSLSGLSTALSVAQGGTASTSASGARSALGAAASGANSDITSMTGLTTALSVAQGGTGGTTAAAARTALTAAASGANADITSMTGLTTALSVAQGGTGGTTAAAARTALTAAASGANADITSITGIAASGNSDNAPTTGGTTTAYTLALTPFTRSTGATVHFFANATNAASPTLNVNASGAAPLFSAFTGAALAAGNLPTGKMLMATFDGTNWVVQIPPISFAAANLSCTGPIAISSFVVCSAITATNMNVGDFVSCTPTNGDPATTAGQVTWSSVISTAAQISIRLSCNNGTASTCSLTARNWRCAVQL